MKELSLYIYLFQALIFIMGVYCIYLIVSFDVVLSLYLSFVSLLFGLDSTISLKLVNPLCCVYLFVTFEDCLLDYQSTV